MIRQIGAEFWLEFSKHNFSTHAINNALGSSVIVSNRIFSRRYRRRAVILRWTIIIVTRLPEKRGNTQWNRAKSGKFGQSPKFGQRHCFFHFLNYWNKIKLTKQTVKILMRLLLMPSHLDVHCLQMYVRVYPLSEVIWLYPIVKLNLDPKLQRILGSDISTW